MCRAAGESFFNPGSELLLGRGIGLKMGVTVDVSLFPVLLNPLWQVGLAIGGWQGDGKQAIWQEISTLAEGCFDLPVDVTAAMNARSNKDDCHRGVLNVVGTNALHDVVCVSAIDEVLVSENAELPSDEHIAEVAKKSGVLHLMEVTMRQEHLSPHRLIKEFLPCGCAA